MRKVSKNFDDIPAKLKSPACTELIRKSLVEKGSHAFDTNVYGHTDVRQALDQIYHSKCAFCETDPSAGVTMQVEHYRPKAKVTGASEHPGYYWLADQWSNLLLACPACNNKKRNRFPVPQQVARVDTHPLAVNNELDTARCHVMSAELSAEKALLVNPETDPNPMQHFRFQANGIIDSNTNPGKHTIETCGLNRGQLVLRRKKVYDSFLNRMMKQFELHLNGLLNETTLKTRLSLIVEELIDYILDEKNEYSEFAKTCWQEFEGFYLARFQPAQRQQLKIVHDEIKALLNE